MVPPPDEDPRLRRVPWVSGPEPAAASGWLALDDDELLFRIERADPRPRRGRRAAWKSCAATRHFFVRQEAAKKIRDNRRLRAHSGDRHIGQILVRAMNRREDAAYLESLVRESRHIEVKKAAEAQLSLLTDKGDER